MPDPSLFTSYHSSERGATEFRTRDGRSVVFIGEEADRLRKQVDEEQRARQQVSFEDALRQAQRRAQQPQTTTERIDDLEQIGGLGGGAVEPPPAPRVPADRAHAVPTGSVTEQIDALEPVTGRLGVVPPRSTPEAAFTRSNVAGLLDTAMLPVTLTARGLRAVGVDNPTVSEFADLQADNAIRDATWLATGEEAGDYQRRVAREREDFPVASAIGAELGSFVGGLGMEGAATRAAGRAARTANTALQFGQEGIEHIRKRVRNWTKKHPSKRAVDHYTGNGYTMINDALRNRDLDDLTARQIADLDMFLADAERAGHAVQVNPVRGVRLPADVLDDWLSRGYIKNGSFWSTTTNNEVAEQFAAASMRGAPKEGKVPTILRLQPKSGGVPVGFGEDEILLSRNRTWQISGAKNQNGVTVIDLVEVDDVPPGVTPAWSFDGKRHGPGKVDIVRPVDAGRPVSEFNREFAHEQQEGYAEGTGPAQIGDAAMGAVRGVATGAVARQMVPGAQVSRAQQKKQYTDAVINNANSVGVHNMRIYPESESRDMTALHKAYAGATPEEVEQIATGAMPPKGSISGRPLPPIEVNYYTGEGRFYLKDGHHRLFAAREAGAQNIHTKVRVYGPRGGLIGESEAILPIHGKPGQTTPFAEPPTIPATRAQQRKQVAEESIQRAREMGVSNMKFNRDAETMRPASLETTRGLFKGADPEAADEIATGVRPPAGSKAPMRPIDVDIYPAENIVTLADGRHRLQAAQEAGAQNIRARVTVYGPRGAKLEQREEILPIHGLSAQQGGQQPGQRVAPQAASPQSPPPQPPRNELVESALTAEQARRAAEEAEFQERLRQTVSPFLRE